MKISYEFQSVIYVGKNFYVNEEYYGCDFVY